jgi:hypothetical protein
MNNLKEILQGLLNKYNNQKAWPYEIKNGDLYWEDVGPLDLNSMDNEELQENIASVNNYFSEEIKIDAKKLAEEIKNVKTLAELDRYKDIAAFYSDRPTMEYREVLNTQNVEFTLKEAIYNKELEFIPKKANNKCWGCGNSDRGRGTDSMWCQICRNNN